MCVTSSDQRIVDVDLQGAKVEREEEGEKKVLLADEGDEEGEKGYGERARKVEKKSVGFGELIGSDECAKELRVSE